MVLSESMERRVFKKVVQDLNVLPMLDCNFFMVSMSARMACLNSVPMVGLVLSRRANSQDVLSAMMSLIRNALTMVYSSLMVPRFLCLCKNVNNCLSRSLK